MHPVRSSALPVTLALSALITAALSAQQTPPVPLRLAASSYATVEVHLNSRPIGNEWYEEDAALTGPARIAISYGQPHARGRVVEGRLIPRDTVWRMGANIATTLHSDLDLTLGGAKLGRGDYTLFVLYTQAGWQLVVNRATGIWGTDYNPARDLVRVPLARRELAEAEESFTVYLVPDSPRPSSGYAELAGTLKLRWGRSELSVPWSVDH